MSTTYDLGRPDYWEQGELDKELYRVFDICHGCRRCHRLCPSFDLMLGRIDEAGEAEVAGLKPADYDRVVDLCYQCKLCVPHCPYTPPHRWMVDFPRLMLRAKAVKAKQRGVTSQDWFLGQTDLLGQVGVATARLSNWLGQVRAHRFFLEETVGLARGRTLPRFNRQTFRRWFAKRARRGGPAEEKTALFYTCSVNYHELDTGRASVAVLEHNGVDVACPPQKCCGMPFLDGGDVESARRNAAFNVKHLARAVRAGRRVVSPGPTCTLMLKTEYPVLLQTEEARLVADNTADICEYLAGLKRAQKLKTDFRYNPGRIAYHLPCHLKVQNIGFKSRDLLRLTGAQVELVDRCAAVDGTWGLKKQYHQLSRQLAEPLLRELAAQQAEVVVSDCPLAALQIKEGTGRQPLHPVQVLAQAYGLEPPGVGKKIHHGGTEGTETKISNLKFEI